MLTSRPQSPTHYAVEVPCDVASRIHPVISGDSCLYRMALRDWTELPYAMMLLTERFPSADGTRPYWRDQSVSLGDFELSMTRNLAEDDVPTYTATYAKDGLHRDFTLVPFYNGQQLWWSASDICKGAKLTTQQLAEKLLAKLVTFHARSLSKATATSSASPDPSS